MDLSFKLLASVEGSRARAGKFKTLHGDIKTPLFMPVGTQASVRNVSPMQLLESGSQILLANTYHLFLRPGKEVFKKFGGIHSFMKWPKSVLTDSGGYQVFSLSESRKITEEGVIFESYVDGSTHMLSPETSIEMQRCIGSDIMMAMDVCIPSTSDFTDSERAMEQTHRWAVRSLAAKNGTAQALFGIVQGACFENLRKQSAKFISSLPFDGIAIGGLAVGETKSEREQFTELVTGILPQDKPRYLMGVGTPVDLLEAIHRGVDMFDCIIPTKLAEQGVVYTSQGRVQLIRGKYKLADEKLDEECNCSTCSTYSKGYLHHLVKTCEPLSTQLLGFHNIYFFHSLMNKIRESIIAGTFLSFYNERREILDVRDTVREPRKEIPKVGRRPDRRPNVMGEFELSKSKDDFYSIRHSASGEVMHPGSDPMNEARSLYFEQSKLADRLVKLEENEELVVWDVGLGAAFNAMAVVLGTAELPIMGKLTIYSFENNLDALKLALFHPLRFPHLKHAGPHALIEKGFYKNKHLEWHLVEGDFLETMNQTARPDIIFFDPYSSKTNPNLWSLKTFQDLFNHIGKKPCTLYNYTASTVIRARMLLAGFYVSTGNASPPKEATTIAHTQTENHNKLLGKDWFEKLLISNVQNEIDQTRTWDLVEQQIREHPQFTLQDQFGIEIGN